VRLTATLAAAASTLLFAAPGEAGTIGGAMGNVSRATIGISVSVAPRLQLLRAGAQSTGSAAGGNGLRTSQPLCIWGNTPLGTYNVTALGDTLQGFEVGDGNGRAHSVEWESLAGGTGPVAFSSGSTVNQLTAARSVGCGGGATAGIVVSYPDGSGRNPTDDHAGTLLLLVAPD
jgi:hypothetical protein